MALMMNKHAMINSCKIILKNKNNFFVKNHCEIQVCTILVYILYIFNISCSNPVDFGYIKTRLGQGVNSLDYSLVESVINKYLSN
jgi:hypothetical protein